MRTVRGGHVIAYRLNDKYGSQAGDKSFPQVIGS
jgi:hypothetical protein